MLSAPLFRARGQFFQLLVCMSVAQDRMDAAAADDDVDGIIIKSTMHVCSQTSSQHFPFSGMCLRQLSFARSHPHVPWPTIIGQQYYRAIHVTYKTLLRLPGRQRATSGLQLIKRHKEWLELTISQKHFKTTINSSSANIIPTQKCVFVFAFSTFRHHPHMLSRDEARNVCKCMNIYVLLIMMMCWLFSFRVWLGGMWCVICLLSASSSTPSSYRHNFDANDEHGIVSREETMRLQMENCATLQSFSQHHPHFGFRLEWVE